MLYNFYCYHLVRFKSKTDEWHVYVTKAHSEKNAKDLAEQHAEILNQELAASREAAGKPPPRLGEQWAVETYFKFDMSRINQGFPVLVGSFNIDGDDYDMASNM